MYIQIIQFFNLDNIQNIYKNNNTKWFIHTLDGKTNFIHKIPYFCLSICIINNQEINFSVIYDPIKNDLFTSIKGKGTQLNGRRIRCKTYNNIAKKIFVIYFNYIHVKKINLCMLITKILLKENIQIRNFGCSGLDLAYLAAGKIDLYINLTYQYNHNIFGELQARESGALITDLFGGCNYIQNKNVLIGHAKTLKFVLKKYIF
nr:inositol monophosphatase family protein [Buchnera aphidicola]